MPLTLSLYGYLSQRYKKQGEFGQIIQKSEKQKTKKTSKLFPGDKVAAEDWAYVTEKCKEALAYIAEARK